MTCNHIIGFKKEDNPDDPDEFSSPFLLMAGMVLPEVWGHEVLRFHFCPLCGERLIDAQGQGEIEAPLE